MKPRGKLVLENTGKRSMPFGYALDGQPLNSPSDFPFIVFPTLVHVEKFYIQIDDWIFPFGLVSKEFLEWFRDSCHSWSTNQENKRWAELIAYTLQQRICGEF